MFLENCVQAISLMLWIFLNLYLIAVEIRFLVQWFLNINPYFEPFLTLWAFTNPVFQFGRYLYPKFFGIEIAPLVNFKLLAMCINLVEPVAFYNS
jgi:uncharacterized protein YggT (Ycf19 family)